MTPRLVIIADDLTGALDSAEPFASHGLTVAVATSLSRCDEAIAARPDILAINTDSRALPPAEAAGAIARAWSIVAPLRPDILLKKIDSRLKGNLTSEIATLHRLSQRSRIVIAPAIPSMGRIVAAGRLAGFGIETPLAIEDHVEPLPNLSIPDCPDDDTLTAIAKDLIADGTSTLAVGARGLAEAIAVALGTPRSAQPSPVFNRLLMVIGSRDPITIAQLDHLEKSGIPVQLVSAPNGLIEIPIAAQARLLVVRTTAGESARPANQIARNLGHSGWSLLQRNGIDAILASGGDTAMAFVRAAGIDTLHPIGALAPGIPYARAGNLTLITKSGGFGSPDALTRIAQAHLAGQR